MAKKFYGVRRGHTTGVFDNWEDCKSAVSGFPGAEYKGFGSKQEAYAYVGDDASYSERAGELCFC